MALTQLLDEDDAGYVAPDVGKDAYSALPEPIKASMTHKEWLWLSDAEKQRLIQTETEPETED